MIIFKKSEITKQHYFIKQTNNNNNNNINIKKSVLTRQEPDTPKSKKKSVLTKQEPKTHRTVFLVFT